MLIYISEFFNINNCITMYYLLSAKSCGIDWVGQGYDSAINMLGKIKKCKQW